jgi:hypothetical protein
MASAARGTRVPPTYHALAVSGERVRYNGFWLGDSAEDRIVAKWLDQHAISGASAMIKRMIIDEATGRRKRSKAITYDDIVEARFIDDKEDSRVGNAGCALLDMDV